MSPPKAVAAIATDFEMLIDETGAVNIITFQFGEDKAPGWPAP
jgi:hypothetical protein